MSQRFEIDETPLQGLKVVQRKPAGDSRGYFERLFCAQELDPLLCGKSVAQINHTLTVKRGAARGMHFQMAPHAEMKFVSCIRGEVFDVAVDLRRKSPTFLRWYAEVLSEINHRSLLIPEGFAHGFQALTDNCELLYLHTATYQPSAEAALNVSDPRVAISWPLPIAEMSERDRAHPMLSDKFEGIEA